MTYHVYEPIVRDASSQLNVRFFFFFSLLFFLFTFPSSVKKQA